MSLKMSLRTPLLTLLALGATAAFAHAELESSTPDDGQTVNTAPTQVELVFSEGLETSVSTFKVYPLPDDLAAAEATAVRNENLEPIDDTSDDSHDDDTSESGSDDHSDASSDDHADSEDHSEDHSDDQSDDHGLDPDSGGVATFVASVINTEGDEGERVDTGVSSQGSEISIDLASDLPAGWYVAMWSALSDDGHPVEGYVTFNFE